MTGALAAVFRRHGSGRSVAVRLDAVRAVEAGGEGQDEHKSALHIGGPHPLRLSDAFHEVIEALGWSEPE